MSTFGMRLKEMRLEKRINQRNLAEAAGIDVTYLSKIENGKMDPPGEETVLRLAKSLGVDSTELLILARKVPPDVRAIITASTEVSAFLRTASHLNPDEWRALRNKIEANQGDLFDLLDQNTSQKGT